MDEKMHNEMPEIVSVSDEDLVEVSGGDDINNEKWINVDVKDGPNNSALCPYCVGVKLSYDGRAKMFNQRVWKFHCPKCNKMFIKNADWHRWRVKV